MDSVTTIILSVCVTMLLTVLYIFRQSGVMVFLQTATKTLAEHSAKHGLNYLIGFCLVTGACFTAFYDNFGPVEKSQWALLGWWQILALVSKSLASAPAALLGFLLRSPLTPPTPPAPDTSSNTPKP